MKSLHGALLFPCDKQCFINAQRGELCPPTQGVNQCRDFCVMRLLPMNKDPVLGPEPLSGNAQRIPQWLLPRDEATITVRLDEIQASGDFAYQDITQLWPVHKHSRVHWTYVLVLSPMAIKTREWYLARDGTLVTDQHIPWLEIQTGLQLVWNDNPHDATQGSVHWTKFYDCEMRNAMLDYDVASALGQLETSM